MTNANDPINSTTYRQIGDNEYRIATEKDKQHGIYLSHKEGLTKREYFTAIALQGILSNGYNSVIQGAEHAVIEAVSVADLIILQLNQPHDQPKD